MIHGLPRYTRSMMRRLMKRKYKAAICCILVALATLNFYTEIFSSGTRYSLNVLFFGEQVLQDPFQADIDYIAENLQVKYAVVSNDGHSYLANYTFVNKGGSSIQPYKWKLFFYAMFMVEPSSYPYPSGFFVHTCNLQVHHFNGNLYWFEPIPGHFETIEPGKSIVCLLVHAYVQTARSISMPNWYITGTNLSPRVLSSTHTEDLSYVDDFNRPEQYNPDGDDQSHPLTSTERYDSYRFINTKDTVSIAVLPTPLQLVTDSSHTLEWSPQEWVVVNSVAFPDSARNLAVNLKARLVSSTPLRRYIDFTKSDIDFGRTDIVMEEAYTLTTDAAYQRIHIHSATEAGSFYAVQTVLSILHQPKGKTYSEIPSFIIRDAPRFAYRGLHIDVARNFHGPNQLKKLMEAMALYKMNKLHLHLSDDDGWRLEIPGMPHLTKIGSRRCHDPEEQHCIMSMLGSGPHANTSGSGYFGVSIYRRLLQLAVKLHIEIIPEFDMPGHSHAAIASYLALSRENTPNADAYAIVDKNDLSDVESGQLYKNYVINPCIPATYEFVKKLMSEVKRLHDEVQPLRVFHFGGDEVVSTAWVDSKACLQQAEQNPELKSHYGKMKYFVEKISKIASGLGLSLGSWEDGVISHAQSSTGTPFPRSSFDNKDIYVYVWKNTVEKSTPHRLRIMANYGYKVVMAYAPYFYFDHPYEVDPEERGLRWATQKISLEDVWGFTPKISEADRALKCPREVKDKTDCFELKKPENIIGIQAEVWTETIRTADQMDYMLFPRLLAVAERAWHKSAWEDKDNNLNDIMKAGEYAEFISQIGDKEFERLDMLDINYRIPPPGARVDNGNVWFRTEFPGLTVEYFDEQHNTWRPVSKDLQLKQPLKIRTRSSDGRRFSREVTVEMYSGSRSSFRCNWNTNILQTVLTATYFTAYVFALYNICS